MAFLSKEFVELMQGEVIPPNCLFRLTFGPVQRFILELQFIQTGISLVHGFPPLGFSSHNESPPVFASNFGEQAVKWL